MQNDPPARRLQRRIPITNLWLTGASVAACSNIMHRFMHQVQSHGRHYGRLLVVWAVINRYLLGTELL